MRYSLQQLRVFVEICRLGSVSLAAESLGMSQSATSTALAELERRSNTRLFDRAGKRLHLNEMGRSLLPAARDLLDRAVEFDGQLSGGGGPGPVTIGATMTIGNYVIPDLIDRYWRIHPGAPIAVRMGNTRDTLARVLAFELDVALIEGSASDPDLRILPWLDDLLVPFCASSHMLAGAATVTMDQLLDQPWVVRERGSGTREVMDRAIAPWRDRWRIALELEQIESMLRLVAIGRLIGCASRLTLSDGRASGRLVELRAPELVMQRRFSIVIHREKFETAAMRAFLAVCEDVARDTPTGFPSPRQA